jgi:hypothetical protein
MADIIIQNPVINSPFVEPTRHFEFGDRGITGRIIHGSHRESSYFVPIPQGRRQSAQLSLEAEWTKDRLRANDLVNRIREKVRLWRQGRYAGIPAMTASLLQYWTETSRDAQALFLSAGGGRDASASSDHHCNGRHRDRPVGPSSRSPAPTAQTRVRAPKAYAAPDQLDQLLAELQWVGTSFGHRGLLSLPKRVSVHGVGVMRSSA